MSAKSNDQLDQVKSIIQGMNEIIEKLDEIGLGNEINYFGSSLRGGIKAAISMKSGLHQDLYGVEPKPSREEQRIRSCELHLEKVKELYDFYKKASRKARYSLKGGRDGVDISAENLERLRERVEKAKENLELAKGIDPQEILDRKNKRIYDRIEKDRLESENTIRTWQDGWRKRADSLREKK